MSYISRNNNDNCNNKKDISKSCIFAIATIVIAGAAIVILATASSLTDKANALGPVYCYSYNFGGHTATHCYSNNGDCIRFQRADHSATTACIRR